MVKFICYVREAYLVEKHLGEFAFKRLITTHRKDLLIGDYLIDDRTVNGAGEFTGEHIHFGTVKFPNWEFVVKYLIDETLERKILSIIEYNHYTACSQKNCEIATKEILKLIENL